MRRYKLCRSFGLNVDQRLKSKKSLDHKDFDEVCRAICVSIIQHTHNPSSDAIRKIVGLFFERYPEQMFKNSDGDGYDEVSSVVIYGNAD